MFDIKNMYFRRKFSLTMYKNKRLCLGEMSFYKDFVNDKRGDLYPVLDKCGDFSEKIYDAKYHFSAEDENSFVTRLLGAYFPYATYEMRVESLSGRCGFAFKIEDKYADILFEVNSGKVSCIYENERIDTDIEFTSGISFVVTSRRKNFDIYIKTDGFAHYAGTFSVDAFEKNHYYDVFSKGVAGVYMSGCVTVSEVEFYMDCGISQADIRPIRYENGEIMMENGRIYLTMSVRMQEDGYQGVFSWIPGTGEFELTGALFFDVGDGMWGNDVASSILYHREKKCFYIWVCSFCHGHIAGHGIAEGDVRFGVNVIDIKLMDKMCDCDDDKAFLGKEGDEDPDFVFDSKTGKWTMVLCRLVSENGKDNYRYFLFESNNPFDGYKYVANAKNGEETGGSIIKMNSGMYFVCGSGFDKRAEYHIYDLPDMDNYSLIKCDYDDGGFRGWGTVMPIKQGSRMRYYWLTFDRHLGSDYNWSYGNIYCYLAE